LEPILSKLTPEDVRQLVVAEDELSQCRGFIRLFPSTTAHSYFRFLEEPRYYNMLLDAWEHKYGDRRQLGIRRLRELCDTSLHLTVPHPLFSDITKYRKAVSD